MDVQRSKATRKIWPQVDALKLAMNWSERDLDKLQILVDDVQGESHPGSYHLDVLAEQVSQGVLESGGKAPVSMRRISAMAGRKAMTA